MSLMGNYWRKLIGIIIGLWGSIWGEGGEDWGWGRNVWMMYG
jgi:hypothetical protein